MKDSLKLTKVMMVEASKSFALITLLEIVSASIIRFLKLEFIFPIINLDSNEARIATLCIMLIISSSLFFKRFLNFFVNIGYTRKQFYFSKLFLNIILADIFAFISLLSIYISGSMEVNMQLFLVNIFNNGVTITGIILVYFYLFIVYFALSSSLTLAISIFARYNFVNVILVFIIINVISNVFVSLINLIVKIDVYPINAIVNMLPQGEVSILVPLTVYIIGTIIFNGFSYRNITTTELS